MGCSVLNLAGSACSFAHGAQELGTPVASVAPSGPSGDAGNGGLWKTKSCSLDRIIRCSSDVHQMFIRSHGFSEPQGFLDLEFVFDAFASYDP